MAVGATDGVAAAPKTFAGAAVGAAGAPKTDDV